MITLQLHICVRAFEMAYNAYGRSLYTLFDYVNIVTFHDFC